MQRRVCDRHLFQGRVVDLSVTRPLDALVSPPTRCRVKTAGSVDFGRRQPVESISVGIDRGTVEQHTFRAGKLDVSERECMRSATAQRRLEKWLRARADWLMEGRERVFIFLIATIFIYNYRLKILEYKNISPS